MSKRIFAVLAADGFPLGFYTSDVHPRPPEGAVEVSEAHWRECLDNQGQRRFVAGRLVPAEPPRPTADDVRAECHRRIIAFMPDWKQRNALARSQELQEVRETRVLTADEEAEAEVIRQSWGWIKLIRRSSNIMEPEPPADYRDDIHWPTRPTE